MSDRLYQVASVPDNEMNPDILVVELTSIVRSLEAGAESRPFPVALDWSDFRVNFEPHQSFPGHVRITASAPVL